MLKNVFINYFEYILEIPILKYQRGFTILI